ncbi:MAG: 4-hydroxy-tetrahydrodipicolinate synthase [Pseudomonadales bacterium]|jgi:4-hydroxy-tetrahydrodipicolinate synthase|nr:4-hydroxy-tetrahydrodipicolinate synthase [Pseudomonadales bacterium]MDP6471025.1 4-hydroxy-tetrahydrodipicolinate synthase [Pseudomonadales bacterium]MDP6825789.1 4-hydroxy-tetrahydrodipicolinate synthase [Pseudomonadales bacterium]MDP6970217.1 4-hydroxy-tetrahydrodipicolinate synthase [Pseudomonadales bacterium]|tara:strand:- start:1168 stop:2055 length:888 start_codon:yes stop_codon:yes gene_type:complete
MEDANLKGSIVALVTPMTPDGDVDWPALDGLIQWHLESGTNGIVPMGTTGESATLTTDEHLQVIRTTIEIVAGQVPVIAGTGSNATAEAIHQTQEAQRHGADACLLVTPYYNKPTQEGLFQHYKAIAEACPGPIVLYNVPPRTASDMSAETVARLAAIDNIVGIKEACGDAGRVGAIRELVDDGFIVLSGEDAQTLDMLKLGAVGAISVTANVLPGEMSRFCQSWLEGRPQDAQALDTVLQPVHATMFIEPNPTPAKWALYEMKRIQRGIRLPLLELSASRRDEVIQALRAVGAL